MGTGKNTSATKAHTLYNMKTHDLQQGRGVGGGGNPAQASCQPVLQPFGAGLRPACQTGGTKRQRRGMWVVGGGG